MQLELTESEAEYVADILQMWIEGIEQEIPRLMETPSPEEHWVRFGLRKQLTTASEVKMRIDLLKGPQ